jgi:transposase
MICCDTLKPDPTTLPRDIDVLQQLVLQLFDELQKSREQVERMERHMDLLLRRIYGRTSEKLDPNQGLLFELPGESSAEGAKGTESDATNDQDSSRSKTSPNRHAHGRGRLPDTIERVEVVHDLTAAEKESLGGEEHLVEIGEERSEQADWKPSSLFVTVHVRKKYARREQLPESGLSLAEQNVVVARKPPEAIPGCLAGPGLLAQVIVSKYSDHLPLYRLEGIFERQGLKLPRQTLDGWVLKIAQFLLPLHELMKQIVLTSFAVHTDDTPVKIRDAFKKMKYTGRFWNYVGDARHPLTVFDYTTSHKRDGPAEFLKNYQGYLQADAFNGYDGIFLGSNGSIVEAGCFAHARRKFFDNQKADTARTAIALAWIGKLYAIEKELRVLRQGEWKELGLSIEEQVARIECHRQLHAKPLLEQFHAWLESEAPKLLPKNPVRQATDYALGNWAALCRYVESGWLDIDNNVAENVQRHIALGRKNWLFCGSDNGGRAAAIFFSLIVSCKRHGLDPFAYLRDILTRLPAILPTATPEELAELLPHRWQPPR